MHNHKILLPCNPFSIRCYNINFIFQLAGRFPSVFHFNSASGLLYNIIIISFNDETMLEIGSLLIGAVLFGHLFKPMTNSEIDDFPLAFGFIYAFFRYFMAL